MLIVWLCNGVRLSNHTWQLRRRINRCLLLVLSKLLRRLLKKSNNSKKKKKNLKTKQPIIQYKSQIPIKSCNLTNRRQISNLLINNLSKWHKMKWSKRVKKRIHKLMKKIKIKNRNKIRRLRKMVANLHRHKKVLNLTTFTWWQKISWISS